MDLFSWFTKIVGEKMNCKFCKADCCTRGKDRDSALCAGWVKMTNADRIRSMTDEEIVKLFMTKVEGFLFFSCPVDEPCEMVGDPECEQCFLRWLQKEVE